MIRFRRSPLACESRVKCIRWFEEDAYIGSVLCVLVSRTNTTVLSYNRNTVIRTFYCAHPCLYRYPHLSYTCIVSVISSIPIQESIICLLFFCSIVHIFARHVFTTNNTRVAKPDKILFESNKGQNYCVRYFPSFFFSFSHALIHN